MRNLQNMFWQTLLCAVIVSTLFPGAIAQGLVGSTNFITPVATAGDFSSGQTMINGRLRGENTNSHAAALLTADTTNTPQIGAFYLDDDYGFGAVEVHNPSRQFINLSDITIVLQLSFGNSEQSCEAALQGYIPPRSSVRYYHPGLAINSNQALQGCTIKSDGQTVTQYAIIIKQSGMVVDQTQALTEDVANSAIWERKSRTAAPTGVFAGDFRPRTTDTETVAPYELPPAPKLQVLEVLPRPFTCEESPGNCSKYIKIKNVSDQAIDLSLYRLRSGKVGTKSTARNTSVLVGILAPGQVATINSQADGAALAINQTAGTLWFEDQYGLTAYPSVIDMYTGANTMSNKGKIWTYNPQVDTWQWVAVGSSDPEVTPSHNQSKQKTAEVSLKLCPAGQQRNPETNRCRKIKNEKTNTTKTSTQQMPCKIGQYRNPTTGRCRNLVLSVNTPKTTCSAGQFRSPVTGRCRSFAQNKTTAPCRVGYYRNPATNRCKKLATANRKLTPCKDGWEHNPETNRCRKIKISNTPKANYPVVQSQNNNSRTAVTWWAVGGIGALAVGYAGWEWRSELSRWLKRIFRVE